MKKPAASGQFLAYQLKQSFRKPRILLWMMSRVSLPLPSQHRPLPTAITFLLGGRLRNPCGSSREEMIFPAQSRWAPSSAPTASGSGVGGTSEAMLMGTVARGWVSSAEILTCFCQPDPKVISTHSSCGDFGGPGGHCCHCFLKTVDPAVAWA